MKQSKGGGREPLVHLHQWLVNFPPPREAAASQYRVGLLRFELGRVLVFHGGVFECSSRMTGNLHVRFLEGWASAMAPGYSTVVMRSNGFKVPLSALGKFPNHPSRRDYTTPVRAARPKRGKHEDIRSFISLSRS